MSVYYYEKHMQQRQWELEREAERQRLAGSIKAEGHAHFMSWLGSWFMELGLQLKTRQQVRPQPKVVTSEL